MNDFEIVCWCIASVLVVVQILIRLDTRSIRKATERRRKEIYSISTSNKPKSLWPVLIKQGKE